MTTQIVVVDINDNANDNVDLPAAIEEVKEVKPRVRKTILKAKAKVKEEIKEEVKKEVKPTTSRDKLKDKVNCPDCGKEVTEHGLKYTHKKYCKALNKPEIEEAPPMPKLERTDT